MRRVSEPTWLARDGLLRSGPRGGEEMLVIGLWLSRSRDSEAFLLSLMTERNKKVFGIGYGYAEARRLTILSSLCLIVNHEISLDSEV